MVSQKQNDLLQSSSSLVCKVIFFFYYVSHHISVTGKNRGLKCAHKATFGMCSRQSCICFSFLFAQRLYVTKINVTKSRHQSSFILFMKIYYSFTRLTILICLVFQCFNLYQIQSNISEKEMRKVAHWKQKKPKLLLRKLKTLSFKYQIKNY